MNNIIKLDFRKVVTEPKADPIQRMKAAAAEMAAELAKTRDEVAGFQAVMGIWGHTVKNLEHSCETYLRKLERINLRRLRRRSLRLARIMDGLLKDQSAAKADRYEQSFPEMLVP